MQSFSRIVSTHIETSAPTITAEEAVISVGVLPSLHQRPNGTNLGKLERDLVDKLSTIPVYQSTDKGYVGMMDNGAFCVFRCPTPWVAWPDPGPQHAIEPANNTMGQADELVQYDFTRGPYGG